jgi:hypothetical protein
VTAPAKAKPAEPETKGLGLSPAATAGGALASVTSTVAASSLGTAGTLWGAAVGSVISTVAAALYTHSLKRGATKVTKVIPLGTPMGATAVPGRDATRTMSAATLDAVNQLPAHLDPRKSKRFDIKLDRKFWLKIAAAAVAMFACVMIAITAVELLTHKPVAALVGDTETSRSTTLGTVTDDTPSTPVPEDDQQEDAPVTTTTPPDDSAPEPEVTEEAEPTPTGGQDITRTAESTQADPSAEADTEEDEPEATEAPAQTTSAPDEDTGASDTE